MLGQRREVVVAEEDEQAALLDVAVQLLEPEIGQALAYLARGEVMVGR